MSMCVYVVYMLFVLAVGSAVDPIELFLCPKTDLMGLFGFDILPGVLDLNSLLLDMIVLKFDSVILFLSCEHLSRMLWISSKDSSFPRLRETFLML